MSLRPFELALIIIFGLLMALSLVLVRLYTPEPDQTEVALGGDVLVWGMFSEESFYAELEAIQLTNKAFERVSYRYVSPEDFDSRFINALADGVPPDVLLLPHELLTKYRNRLQVFPYESFPLRDLRSNYIDGAELFALGDGIYGYPVAVDPLIMYWNRDLFAEANLLAAPATWESVVAETVPKLTKRDFNRSILTSGLAMGEYKNIKNAFPIISMLMIQGGSALVAENDTRYTLRLDERVNGESGRPLTSAITFFTNFSSISNTLYSWNRSLPLDRDMFLREELAVYFGFGSEAKSIALSNPNLNFDIALVPQGQGSTISRTYGTFYALMVPKAARNKVGAYTVMQTFAGSAITKRLAEANGMASVYRGTVIAGSSDIYARVIYGAAPLARGWLSPDPAAVATSFTILFDDVSANRQTISAAVNDVQSRLGQSY